MYVVVVTRITACVLVILVTLSQRGICLLRTCIQQSAVLSTNSHNESSSKDCCQLEDDSHVAALTLKRVSDSVFK